MKWPDGPQGAPVRHVAAHPGPDRGSLSLANQAGRGHLHAMVAPTFMRFWEK